MPIVLCLLLLAWPLGDAAAQAAPSAENQAIRALIARGSLPQLRHPDFTEFRRALDDSYGPGGYAPLWLATGATAPVIAELKNAPSHGLELKDYDVAWLEGEWNAIAAGDRSPDRVARADVALTVALFNLLSDVHDGRVSPARQGFKLEAPGNLDLAAVLRRGKETGSWHDVLVASGPQFVLYRRLEAALARYRTLASQPVPALPPLPAGKRKIAPGDSYAGIAAVSDRLRLVGDLPADFVAPAGNKYEGALVEGVKRFQDRHGLTADGVIGSDTLAQLAVPFSDRVRQIELSLERLRWLPKLPAARSVIAVNIPSFRLWAFADAANDTAAQLTMPVIVGRAAGARKTPVFIGEMRYIEFSPYWNVPPAILRSETIPKLERDPGYWQTEDLEAVPVSGPATPITAFNAQTLEGLKSGKLRVRQRPGPKNALGAVKFVLPNTMDIYLHSTPAKQLFSETRRDFSHGCIRVSDPPALAAFVLRDQPEWTKERIEEAMNSGKSNTAKLTQPLPVVLFYTTAIVDSTGAVRFTSDIYGYDQKLEALLRQAT